MAVHPWQGVGRSPGNGQLSHAPNRAVVSQSAACAPRINNCAIEVNGNPVRHRGGGTSLTLARAKEHTHAHKK